MDHSFDVEDAVKYGVEAAVILKNIRHWTKKNEANEKHFYEGYYWTYNSVKAFGKLFPYLTTKQISTRLKKLIDAGVIIEGNFNKHGYDKTKWYAVKPNDSLILPNGKKDFTKREIGSDQMEEPIPYNKPNSKPDDKPSLPETKVSDDVTFEEVEIKKFPITLITPAGTEKKEKVALKEKKYVQEKLMSEVLLSEVPEEELEYFEIAEAFRKLFIKNQEERDACTNDQEEAKYKNYVPPIRLMMTKGKKPVTREQLQRVFKFLSNPEGDFWKPNILSTKKLREKIGQLTSKSANIKLKKTFEDRVNVHGTALNERLAKMEQEKNQK